MLRWSRPCFHDGRERSSSQRISHPGSGDLNSQADTHTPVCDRMLLQTYGIQTEPLQSATGAASLSDLLVGCKPMNGSREQRPCWVCGLGWADPHEDSRFLSDKRRVRAGCTLGTLLPGPSRQPGADAPHLPMMQTHHSLIAQAFPENLVTSRCSWLSIAFHYAVMEV